MTPRFRSLLEALEAAARERGPQPGFTFLDGSGPQHLPFAALADLAKSQAAALQRRGVAKGDRVLLDVPASPAFATAYFAVLMCGAAPCVLPSTDGVPNRAEALRRARAIAQQLDARLLLTDREATYAGADGDASIEVRDVAELRSDIEWHPVAVGPDDLAVVQASSGTTGTAKCVALTHANVLANLHQIGIRLRVSERDVAVSWLPMFHDMGLIGCFLFSVYWGLHCALMTPFRFLRRPAAWLRAISDYRGTLSPAPNFAYALAARRLNGDDLAGLDLRSWRAALCGAEQIDVATLEAFAARFAGCSFDPHSFTPCYGLAEAALAVTICEPGRPLTWEHVSRDRLASDRVAVPVTESRLPGGLRLCDCGPVVDGTRIRITGDAGEELPDGHVGEIWMAGPSIAAGYYNDPDLGAKVVRDGWFATGDLGYLRGGRLFVAGRRKDLIVIRGHNYQPADFESVAAEVPGVAAGRVVAFGTWSAAAATEELYLLCEKTQASELGDDELAASIKAHVARQTGVLPAVVGLVPRNYIARTTSGKVQRAATKAMFLSGAGQ